MRPLPAISFDTDEVVPAVVNPHARIAVDGNRYSAPPQFVRRPITIRANRDELRLLHEGQVVAQHVRSYQRGQLLVLPEHRLAALTLRQRPRQQALAQEFDAWGPEAREFHLRLNSRPVKTGVHVRRLLNLAQLYGRTEVLAAISRALELATYDAACVENLLLAERRRRQLPTPTLPTPKRRELIDDIELEPADPAFYDRYTASSHYTWPTVTPRIDPRAELRHSCAPRPPTHSRCLNWPRLRDQNWPSFFDRYQQSRSASTPLTFAGTSTADHQRRRTDWRSAPCTTKSSTLAPSR